MAVGENVSAEDGLVLVATIGCVERERGEEGGLVGRTPGGGLWSAGRQLAAFGDGLGLHHAPDADAAAIEGERALFPIFLLPALFSSPSCLVSSLHSTYSAPAHLVCFWQVQGESSKTGREEAHPD